MSFDLFEVRSVLFLPASNPRAIAKARESQADLRIFKVAHAEQAGWRTLGHALKGKLA